MALQNPSDQRFLLVFGPTLPNRLVPLGPSVQRADSLSGNRWTSRRVLAVWYGGRSWRRSRGWSTNRGVGPARPFIGSVR